MTNPMKNLKKKEDGSLEKQFEGSAAGISVRKIDSPYLTKGNPMYVDDIDFKGLLHAKLLYSPHAHAIIKNIDISEAEKYPGVHCVLCYKNVDRILHTTAGQGHPEPSPYDAALFEKKMRYVGDRVAVVAAESESIAEEALKLIKVEYEVLKPILNMEEAIGNDIIIHDEEDAFMPIPVFYEPKKNHVSHTDFMFGDIEKGLKDADAIVDRKYITHYAQHVPIEPHITIGYIDDRERLVLRTSTQVPFHARRITAKVLDIPVKKIRVIKPRIGGAFGTKQEVLLEPIVGMLTWRTKRPVRLLLDRSEEIVSSRTRHPMTVWVRTGAKKSGKITALDLKVLSNTGAYGSHGLTVMSNCGSKVLPLYKTNNVAFTGDTCYTNLPVGGAYRGYGATQAAFGVECAMDELAEKIGMDPVEFRLINHIKEGEGSPVFKALGEGTEGVEQTIDSCGLTECIKQGAEAIGWKDKFKKEQKGNIRRGVGMCILMQGSSIPEIDMGAAYAKMNEDGSFNLLVGATDLGTGSDTVLAQIFAEELDIPVEDVIVYSSDTDMTPFDVGAYASSTTYLSGEACRKAAVKIREQVIKVAAEMMEDKPENLDLSGKKVVNPDKNSSISFAEICQYALYTKNQFQIASVASHISHKSPPPFAAHFAEVKIDIETGVLELLNFVAAVDCGTAINPRLAEGQTEGAVMNGISYALTEEILFSKKGVPLNANFGNYKIWSTADYPNLKTILIPTYEPTGPFGAKSVSEISINGPMPAISNAIYDAVGIRLKNPPFTSEKILKAINEKKK